MFFIESVVDTIYLEYMEVYPETKVEEVPLKFNIEVAIEFVLDFIHWEYLPPQLYNLIIVMVHDSLYEQDLTASGGPVETKSVKEGDFLISFVTDMDKLKAFWSSPNLLRKYKIRLYRYRKLVLD